MPTFTKIASNTVAAAGVASVTFSSIPNTYTDLVLHHSSRSTAGNNNILLSFNGSAGGTSYSDRTLVGTGGSIFSVFNTSSTQIYGILNQSTYTASTFDSGCFYIPNYASSDHKSVSYDGTQESNTGGVYAYLLAGRWSNTAAITSIVVAPVGFNFDQHSSFTLYGISNA
jgi:hypothetical protein